MKKPKLSEIKARPACICNWNPPSEKDYLLDLVERLGKVLETIVKADAVQPVKDYYVMDSLVKEARALHKELEQ